MPQDFKGVKCIASRQEKGVTADLISIDANTQIPDHNHGELIMFAVLRGRIEGATQSSFASFQELTTGIDPNDLIQQVHIGPVGATLLNVYFDTNVLERFEYSPRSIKEIVVRNRPVSAHLFMRIVSELRSSSASIVDFACEALTDQVSTNKSESRQPKWLRAAHDLIRNSYAMPIGLCSVAEEVGINPMHLARVFRAYYGCTVSDAIRSYRLVETSRLIFEDSMPISQAAIQAGFCDHSHFTRQYKDVVGLPPKLLKSLNPISS